MRVQEEQTAPALRPRLDVLADQMLQQFALADAAAAADVQVGAAAFLRQGQGPTAAADSSKSEGVSASAVGSAYAPVPPSIPPAR